jgi:DNA-binding NarL/FixJ family response regulator
VLPRTATAAQLNAAVRAVAAGLWVRAHPPVSPHGFRDQDDDHPIMPLTPREIEILTAIGDGLSNKAVARMLGISAHTVKFHLEAIFDKLDATTRAEAVAKGLRRGLIEV